MALSSRTVSSSQIVRTVKTTIARLGFPLTRWLVRRLPATAALRLLTGVFTPYCSWRPFETVTTTVDGVRMRVRFPDKIQKHIYLFGVWEPAITRFVTSRLKAGDLFVDIGANVGYYALLAARRVGPRGAVVAIEACPSIARVLRENVALNGFDNIEIIEHAVADRRKELPLFMGPIDNIGSTTTVVGMATIAEGGPAIRVNAFPLPDLVCGERLRAARLIKVDVEGAEADVFDGLRNVLPTFGHRTEWIFELAPDALTAQGRSAAEIMTLFRTNGYRLYVVENSYRMEHYVRLPAPTLTEVTSLPDTRLTLDVIASKHTDARRSLL